MAGSYSETPQDSFSQTTTRPTVYNVGIVGDFGFGGRSLIERIDTDKFTESEAFDSTMCNEFVVKHSKHVKFVFVHPCYAQYALEYAKPSVNGFTKSVERASCCFKEAKFFLVCFDVTSRESFIKLCFFLLRIEKYRHKEHDCFLVLVATKIDMAAERVVSHREARLFAENNSMVYIETSAKTGERCRDIVPLLTSLLSIS